jgi:hypothetical protein
VRRPSGTATRSVWIAAAAVAALFALTAIVYRAPAPLEAAGPAEQFSAVRAGVILRRLVGDSVPHPLGSLANATMRERVIQELQAIGLQPELQRGMACHDGDACGIVTNILARIDGTPGEAQAVLLSAHYDSVPAGPGAADDGAGVAAVLEIARLLKQGPALRHPVILLIDDGEEAGMLGAQLFVSAHRWAHQVAAAVNLEARGTSGPSFMFETGSANNWLMGIYAEAMARPMTNSVYYLAYKLLPNDTDFTIYKTADYQGFNFAFLGDVEHYHTPLDRWQNTDLASLQHQGANALAAVRALGRSELRNPPRAQAVFFDWYGLVLVHWRAALTMLATVIATLLLILLRERLERRTELVIGQMWRGLAALAAAWCCCVVLAALDLVLLRWLGAVPTGEYPWIAHPLAMLISANLLGLLAPALAARWVAKRSGFWDLWAAVQTLNCLLCLTLALAAPDLSFLFLVPLLVAIASAVPAVLATKPLPWMRAIAVLLPLLAAASVTLPLTRFLYEALGALGWCLTSALVGIGLLGLAPLLARATARTRRIFIGVPIACLILCTGITWTLPVYSTAWPQRLNLDYILDADAGHGQWLALPDSGRLPAKLRSAAAFESTARAPYPVSAVRGFLAPAPLLPLPPPELLVQSATLENGLVRYEVRLSSARQAPEMYLVFAAADHVDYAELESDRGPLRVRLWAWPNGATVLDLKTVDDAEVDVSFTMPAQATPKVELLDQSFGVPEQIAPLLAARSTEATASQDGDVTMVARSIPLTVVAAP